WVRGEPIVEHVQRYQLSRFERLELFIKVCAGIQHAHQQGVIHRDIKPANVLVDRIDGTSWPKIIDFGVAAGIVEQAGREGSDSSSRAGTRGYMSPELLAGPASRVDTRTDVYSLGVLLFELLTGARPEQSADLGTDSDSHATATDLLEDLSARSPASFQDLPRELRFILARTLAVDRSCRYEAAAALASDLRRYLNKDVVEAVPGTRAYRMRKFLARHALAVSSVSLVFVALASGLVIAVYGLVEARAQAARAEQMAMFTGNMLSSIDPRVAEGQPTPVLDRLLADAAERVGMELSGQPELRAEIERIIGKVYSSLGQTAPARKHLETALALVDRRRQPDVYLDAGAELSSVDFRTGEVERATERMEELQSYAVSLGEDGRADVLNLQTMLGDVEQLEGNYEGAIAVYQGVLDAIEDPPQESLRLIHIGTLSQLAQALITTFEHEKADEYIGLALEAIEDWDDPAARVKLPGLLNSRAVLFLQQQRYEEAEVVLRQAVEQAQKLFGDEHPEVITTLGNLGSAIRQQGGREKLEASIPYYERVHKMTHERYGADSSHSVGASYNLGNAYRELGRIDKALALHRSAFDQRGAFPKNHIFQGLVFLGLGQTELAAGEIEVAKTHLQAAVERLGEIVGENFYRRLEAMEELAVIAEMENDENRAAALRSEIEALRAEN
ncbi:MAG TPA: serine/threonine-protein kinase, partial [Wenzhouxiangella sp.]|nr:serine/threonine-protein kinase [Wenzhouxiangella sp.]